jgi:anti-sigma B factor antagonist
MEMSTDNVEVAVQGSVAYVRVHGRGTFKVAPGLKQFGMAALEQGCSRVLVEMSDCLGMDSTFMGVLAGLAVHLKKKEGELVLRHLSEKNVFLVKMLGLAHLVHIEQGGAVAQTMPASVRVLENGSNKSELTQTMIAAHELLVEVAPDNILKFKDVLAFLKEDLNRTAQTGATKSLNDVPAV